MSHFIIITQINYEILHYYTIETIVWSIRVGICNRLINKRWIKKHK